MCFMLKSFLQTPVKLLNLIGLHLLLILQVLTDYLSLYCIELSLPFSFLYVFWCAVT